MPAVTVTINAQGAMARMPIIWRLGRKFRVVTNVRQARVTSDFAYVAVQVEGSTLEVEQTTDYLQAIGVIGGGLESSTPTDQAIVRVASNEPEFTVSQANTIYVRLDTMIEAQSNMPVLYRLGKDFDVVVNIERAEFNDEDGGYIEVAISGPLGEIQRAISYLHTTGIHVNPRQRSVTDYSNL